MSGQAQISIWGAGCAGLSLARKLSAQISSGDIKAPVSLHGPLSPAATDSHIWGFWQTDWLSEPASLSKQSWKSWQIITQQGRVTQTSQSHPYHALDSAIWLQDCADRSEGKISRSEDAPVCSEQGLIFDSRTPEVPENSLLQHFTGIEIKVPRPVFDASVLTLMDFRCDQSRGIHFIYLLPFSEDTALVESTLFSEQTEDRAFYMAAIERYLREVYQVKTYEIIREETGCIPMNFLKPRDPALLAIGANGGCVRPSSGYAFAFIQKQVQWIGQQLASGHVLDKIQTPHRRLDSWLDRVFLSVLKAHPEAAPEIFLSMAKVLTGDELAKFMSGLAHLPIYVKLISAMPKKMFINQILPAQRQKWQEG